MFQEWQSSNIYELPFQIWIVWNVEETKRFIGCGDWFDICNTTRDV